MIKFTARLITIALIVIMLGMLTQLTIAQEEDPFYTDYLLANGETIESDFVDGVNAHLYAFLASRGDVVTISMTQVDPDSNPLDPYLMLISSSGEVIAVDDDGGDLFLSAVLRDVRLPQDDVYFLIALDSYGRRFEASQYLEDTDDPMTYTLSLRGINEPDDFADPNLARLNVGDQINITITEDAAVGFALFEGEAGDTVTITTSQRGDEVDTILYLFDPIGSRVAVNDDNTGYYSQIDSFELEEDGIHIIMATVYSFELSAEADSWDAGGEFTLALDS